MDEPKRVAAPRVIALTFKKSTSGRGSPSSSRPRSPMLDTPACSPTYFVNRLHLFQPRRADQMSKTHRESQYPASHPNIHRKTWRHPQVIRQKGVCDASNCMHHTSMIFVFVEMNLDVND